MKRAFISAVLITTLVAGGLIGWVLLGHSAEASDHAAPSAAAETRFVKLNPLLLPVIGSRRVEQTIGLVVALELNNPAQAATVEQNSLKLTDAFITDLYGALEPARLGDSGLIDIEQVKGRLGRASDRVLGQGVIKEVLVQMANQRPILR